MEAVNCAVDSVPFCPLALLDRDEVLTDQYKEFRPHHDVVNLVFGELAQVVLAPMLGLVQHAVSVQQISFYQVNALLQPFSTLHEYPTFDEQ